MNARPNLDGDPAHAAAPLSARSWSTGSTEHVPGQSRARLKNVTVNEPFFQGHFPGYPVMPGVLVIEALVQLSDAARA